MKKHNSELPRYSKIMYTIAAIVMTASILALLYPYFSEAWNAYVDSRSIARYDQQVSNSESDIEKQIKDAEAYNKALYESGGNISQYTLQAGDETEDGTVEYPDEKYESELSFSDGIMCYINIPKIDLSLPVRHYATEKVLEQGAGHLYGSSLPVGGVSTHCVITGHSAEMRSRLFTDIRKLKIGDTFSLTTGNRKLNYEVDQIKVVLPDQLEDLNIEEGKDYCTLVTCTPYAVNTHRLLVRGHRIADDAQTDSTPVIQKVIHFPLLWLLIFAGVLLIMALIIRKIWKKPRK